MLALTLSFPLHFLSEKKKMKTLHLATHILTLLASFTEGHFYNSMI